MQLGCPINGERIAMLYQLDQHQVRIAEDTFVAPDAAVIGRVTLGAGASVWFGAVIRGDVEDITVGAGTNVQDGNIVFRSHHYCPRNALVPPSRRSSCSLHYGRYSPPLCTVLYEDLPWYFPGQLHVHL